MIWDACQASGLRAVRLLIFFCIARFSEIRLQTGLGQRMTQVLRVVWCAWYCPTHTYWYWARVARAGGCGCAAIGDWSFVFHIFARACSVLQYSEYQYSPLLPATKQLLVVESTKVCNSWWVWSNISVICMHCTAKTHFFRRHQRHALTDSHVGVRLVSVKRSILVVGCLIYLIPASDWLRRFSVTLLAEGRIKWL